MMLTAVKRAETFGVWGKPPKHSRPLNTKYSIVFAPKIPKISKDAKV